MANANETVAPFAGAWIEIALNVSGLSAVGVAPFAGAWIEMSAISAIKFKIAVAPFAGAWIEIRETF